MIIKCVVLLATSGLPSSPWMRSPAFDVLLQDHQTSLKSLHHKHALVLSQAESAASQFMSEADAANKRVMPRPREILTAKYDSSLHSVGPIFHTCAGCGGGS
jgi:hypothetical protein